MRANKNIKKGDRKMKKLINVIKTKNETIYVDKSMYGIGYDVFLYTDLRSCDRVFATIHQVNQFIIENMVI